MLRLPTPGEKAMLLTAFSRVLYSFRGRSSIDRDETFHFFIIFLFAFFSVSSCYPRFDSVPLIVEINSHAAKVKSQQDIPRQDTSLEIFYPNLFS